jgi:hypothetical protein
MQTLYFYEGVFTAPLNSNGSYWIFACVFYALGLYLRSYCVAIYFNSDFVIPALGVMWQHKEHVLDNYKRKQRTDSLLASRSQDTNPNNIAECFSREDTRI